MMTGRAGRLLRSEARTSRSSSRGRDPTLLRDRDALLRRLLADGGADGLVEGLIHLVALLLHLVADVLLALLRQLADALLDLEALARLLLDVDDALVRLHLAQLL